MRDSLAVIGLLTIWLSIGFVGLRVCHVVDDLVPCEGRAPDGMIVMGPLTLVIGVAVAVVASYPSHRVNCAALPDRKEP